MLKDLTLTSFVVTTVNFFFAIEGAQALYPPFLQTSSFFVNMALDWTVTVAT